MFSLKKTDKQVLYDKQWRQIKTARVVAHLARIDIKATEGKSNWLDFIYCKIWYHFEMLWIKSAAARRPFTYIMRDILMKYRLISSLIIITQIAGICFALRWNWIFGGILAAIYFIVMGHLVWGTPMILGEQENPPYIEKIN